MCLCHLEATAGCREVFLYFLPVYPVDGSLTSPNASSSSFSVLGNDKLLDYYLNLCKTLFVIIFELEVRCPGIQGHYVKYSDLKQCCSVLPVIFLLLQTILLQDSVHLHTSSPSGRLETCPFLLHRDKAAISGSVGCNGVGLGSGDTVTYVKLFSGAG